METKKKKFSRLFFLFFFLLFILRLIFHLKKINFLR